MPTARLFTDKTVGQPGAISYVYNELRRYLFIVLPK